MGQSQWREEQEVPKKLNVLHKSHVTTRQNDALTRQSRTSSLCERTSRSSAFYPMIEYPPSTGMAVPVIKSEACEARNTAMPARSEDTPQRAAGVRARTLSCRPSTCSRARWVRSVSIQPGSTALAWMLSAAHAQAQERVN